MTRKNIILTAAICYILSAVAAFLAGVLLNEYAILIAVLYLIITAVSIPLLIRWVKRSEKKRELKKLRELSEIIKDLNAMVILWDADFHFIEVNNKLTAVTGYTSDDLRHNVKNLEKLLPPDAFAPSL